MKVFLTALALAVIIGVILTVLVFFERRRCEGCVFYDTPLHYCKIRDIRRKPEEKGCANHYSKYEAAHRH